MPRPSVYMSVRTNIAKVESRTSSSLASFAEAKAYICRQDKYSKSYFHYAETQAHKCNKGKYYVKPLKSEQQSFTLPGSFLIESAQGNPH